MAPYALPIPGYLQEHPKKRRDKEEEANEQPDADPDVASSSSQLPTDAINPRSHGPDTLRQFAVAGLSAGEEIPSHVHPLFPHKPLPSGTKTRRRWRGGRFRDDDDDDEEANKKSLADVDDNENENENDVGAAAAATAVRQYTTRLKHMGTLTALMHRCLDKGDVARAKRAFGLLVRTKDVDIRHGGLWAVGSEILMRDGEEGQQIKPLPLPTGDDEEEREEGEEQQQHQQRRTIPLPRWGSAANMERVQFYFENLIQQYPYDQYRPHRITAVDFWPALFGIEIYNLDAEFRQALHQLRRTEQQQEEEDEDDDDEDGPHVNMDMDLEMRMRMEETGYSDEEEAYEHQRQQQQRDRDEQNTKWAARDEQRSQTRGAAERIAARMDQVVENAPYDKHRELLRLRGNLALFVGDLCLPSRLLLLVEEEEEEEEGGQDLASRNVDDVLRTRAKSREEQGALARRRREHDRARTLFQRILDGGGEVDDWVRKFMEQGEEDESHDGGYGDGW
ncbi:hypothetical protein M426DRAFT_319054 [Hypoxylon sp. CI-4A]|nr:hypothetical protein M426DRAFT_319054 [Hypoxylon sp. CI-4A]